MAFTRLAGQSNITSDFGGGGEAGALAIGFTPSSTVAINAVRINRSAAATQPAQFGIASAIGATPNSVTWISKVDNANMNATGWREAILPGMVTLTAGVESFLVLAFPSGGDAYKTMGPGNNAGTYTGISSGRIWQAAPMTNGWTGPFTNFVQGFDLGTDTPPGPTLTATPNTATMAVDLTVTNATGAITVTRYVVGATPVGTLVRGSFANGRLVPDRDAPLNTDLIYIATDTVGQSAQVTVRLDSDTAVLTVMNNPALAVNVTVLADDAQNYEGRSTTHAILGTPAPLVTTQPPTYRAGTYRFLLPTIDDWLAVRAVFMDGGVTLLRSPCQTEYLDTAFVMTSARNELPWNTAPPRHRIFELDYQAVAPDSTPPRDIAWTWADVPGEFATWADVPLAVPTWADMVTYLPDGEAALDVEQFSVRGY